MISVIVPVYNVEKYVDRCINSLLQQSYSDFEVILVDDGSTDQSSVICDKYTLLDSKVRVIHKKNGGLSDARNCGLDICKGEYITFVDSDDVVSKQYLEILFNIATENHCDIVVANYQRFTSNIVFSNSNSKQVTLSGKEACEKLYSSDSVQFVISTAKLYRSELFASTRFPVGRIHEDEFVTYKLYMKSKTIVSTSEKIYGYFNNEKSIMHSHFSIKKYDAIEALDERKQLFHEKRWNDLEIKTEQLRTLLIASYSIEARKSKIYQEIPQEYKISLIRANHILRKRLNKNDYEFFIAAYYPTYIKMWSYVERVLKLIMAKKYQ